jgi:hypothetical protein
MESIGRLSDFSVSTNLQPEFILVLLMSAGSAAVLAFVSKDPNGDRFSVFEAGKWSLSVILALLGLDLAISDSRRDPHSDDLGLLMHLGFFLIVLSLFVGVLRRMPPEEREQWRMRKAPRR